MRKNNKREPIPDFHEVKVRLRPFLGIKPNTYVPLLYIFTLIVILFFLLIYPGIKAAGVYVTFDSFPQGGYVTIDGNYIGSTPVTKLVKNGEHKVEITKPFYKDYSKDIKIKGNIFATLFFPSRTTVKTLLHVNDLNALIGYNTKDFAENPHIPQILPDTCYSIFSLKADMPKKNLDMYYDFLANSAYFVNSERQIKYLLESLFFISSKGAFTTVQSLVDASRRVTLFSKKQNAFLFWVALSMREGNAKTIISSSSFKDFLNSYIERLKNALATKSNIKKNTSTESLTINGVTFTYIPAGSFVLGNDTNIEKLSSQLDFLIPVISKTESFYMSSTEINNRTFYRFTEEQPFWSYGNKKELISRGLVTSDYLKEFKNGKPAADILDFPVRYVSYYAAEAFTNWFTEKIKKQLPRYVAHLPSEYQWEWAAKGGLPYSAAYYNDYIKSCIFYTKERNGPLKAGSSLKNTFGLQDMSGNLWEWCATWYSDAAYFFNFRGPTVGAERVVRGGSWANKKELVPVYMRGSQPPAWCTAYTGFRLIIEKY